ncbi:hypothetical protein [Marinobacter sp. NSM]|uniref:hypothetical protein n=1 Tax=Marinobacter sp. NSM TaxID=3458004 RepID=UPI00403582B6
MKTLTALGLIAGIAATPLAMADARLDDAKNAVALGKDYGIVEFRSIEFDDDYWGETEIEGWLEDGWYVEVEIDSNGNIDREKRTRSERESYGLSADAVVNYLDAASREGMVWFEDFDVNSRGFIDIEGEDDRGQDLDIDFRSDSLEPIRVEWDD